MGPRLRLPTRPWARRIASLACYLLAVAVGAAVLTTLTRGLGGVLLSVGWSAVLLVPLAVATVPPTPERPPGTQDHLPVLMRAKGQARRR